MAQRAQAQTEHPTGGRPQVGRPAPFRKAYRLSPEGRERIRDAALRRWRKIGPKAVTGLAGGGEPPKAQPSAEGSGGSTAGPDGSAATPDPLTRTLEASPILEAEVAAAVIRKHVCPICESELVERDGAYHHQSERDWDKHYAIIARRTQDAKRLVAQDLEAMREAGRFG